MKKELADRRVRRVYTRSSSKRASSPDDSMARDGKHIAEADNHCLDGPDSSDHAGVSSHTHEIDEELDDVDWEDGSLPSSSARKTDGDYTSKIAIDFDGPPPNSSQQRAVRRATAEEKELAELVHKVHLLCLIARGRIIDNACDDPLIQASLLSLFPESLIGIPTRPNLTAIDLYPIIRWFNNTFHVTSSNSETTKHFVSSLSAAIENCKGTPEEIAAISVALFRALRLTTRFVSILDVAYINPDASTRQDMQRLRSTMFENATLMVDKTEDSLISSIASSSLGNRDNSADVVPSCKKQHLCSKSGTCKETSGSCKVEQQMMDCSSVMTSEATSGDLGTSSSHGVKRKGDMEFEMQLQMALSATEAASQTQTSYLQKESNTQMKNSFSTKASRKMSSQGVSTVVGSKKIGSPLYWAEIYCNGEGSTGGWIHVDAVNGIVNGEDKVEAAAAACRKLLRYVFAFAGSGVKDVTRRYCVKWHKIIPHRVSSLWLEKVLRPLRELEAGATNGHHPDVASTRSSLEDMELEIKALTEPLPTNQQAYRNHQLYAIERWLTKTQILRPKGPVLGFCSGHPVYPRSCVKTLKTKQRWLREALQVKVDELPAKVLKESKKLKKVNNLDGNNDDEDDGSNGHTELFGSWQLEPLQLPHAVNGIVPKNERGQVDVWSEKCLPPGTVHIRLPKVFNVAKRLQIDYAPAMVGFDFKNGKSIPVYDGIVVCREFEDVILEAYAEEEQSRAADERRRNEVQALSRWYQLLSSIITRRRLSTIYGENPPQELSTGAAVKETQDTEANTPPTYHRGSDGGHEHVFLADDQEFDEVSCVRTKRCRCGFSVHVEEM